jgi:methionine synthase II (cobalamin-independent)
MLFPTSLVGSYPQPDWLIDREKLSKQVPRVRAGDLWLVAPGKLEAAQDDATILAIRDQERAASISSVTASSGAKAIPTASLPRSMASTSKNRAS